MNRREENSTGSKVSDVRSMQAAKSDPGLLVKGEGESIEFDPLATTGPMLSEPRGVGVLNADESRLKFTLNGRTLERETPGK